MSLAALGPLLIMAYQGYHCARQAIVESQERHLTSVLESRKIMLEAWLNKVKTDLSFLSLTPCTGKMCAIPVNSTGQPNPEACCKHLDSVKKGSSYYKTIVSYDSDWKRYHQASGPDIRSLLSADFKSRMSTAKGLVVTHAHMGENILIGRPVSDRKKSKVAYIVASLDLFQALAPILSSRTGLGKTGKIYLLFSDGHYLSSPSDFPEMLNQKNYLPDGILSYASPKVFEYKDYRGVKVLGVADTIDELNWTVVAEVDYDEAFEWLGTLRYRAFFTGAITLFVVLIISINIAKKLSEPLKKLAAVSRKIGLGYTKERLERLDGAEAGEVGDAFNKMLDKLEASQRKLMQAASLAAVGELSSSIVHEMRNPLSSVKINLQALRKKVEGDHVHSELADIASAQVARLERMLSDLLSYGKPLELNPVGILFESLAKEIIEMVRSEAEEKKVSIETIDKLGQRNIIADPEQIRRALTNLVANAVEASPRGGKVTVGIKVIENNETMIAVSDNGRGISESQKERLFKPFFTTREGGTGLGLANVKKIVEYHGWRITADNRPEGGAVFTIFLPAQSVDWSPTIIDG